MHAHRQLHGNIGGAARPTDKDGTSPALDCISMLSALHGNPGLEIRHDLFPADHRDMHPWEQRSHPMFARPCREHEAARSSQGSIHAGNAYSNGGITHTGDGNMARLQRGLQAHEWNMVKGPAQHGWVIAEEAQENVKRL